jgi:nitrous oxide reductase accessory protein NosL
MRILGIVALGALLAGCARQPEYAAPPPKPISEMSFAERCAHLIEMSGNFYATPAQKAAFYEMARNDGCMGQPQSQTIIVR